MNDVDLSDSVGLSCGLAHGLDCGEHLSDVLAHGLARPSGQAPEPRSAASRSGLTARGPPLKCLRRDLALPEWIMKQSRPWTLSRHWVDLPGAQRRWDRARNEPCEMGFERPRAFQFP